jgi:hypothetical protein
MQEVIERQVLDAGANLKRRARAQVVLEHPNVCLDRRAPRQATMIMRAVCRY